MISKGLLVFLVIIGSWFVEVKSQSGKYGIIRVTAQQVNENQQTTDNTSATKEYCFSYPATVFSLPTEPEEKFYKLSDATNVDVCNDTVTVDEDRGGNNTLFLFERKGNCSSTEYVKYTKDNQGAGFFVNLLGVQSLNESYGLDVYGLIGNQSLKGLKEYLGSNADALIQVFSFTFEESFFGASIFCLWFTASFCVAIGSLTGPYQDLQSTSSRQQILEGSSSGTSSDTKNLQINFTVTLVMVLVVFITATLLLLYYFYQYLVYVFMAVFCFASGRATYEILNQIAHVFKVDGCMPRIRGCALHKILLAVICITVPIIWFVFRHKDHIWILQDLLGVCFCIHLIQTLRIPNLQMCTVLLSLLFIYDVFFVFVTPYITPNGKSVMVEVATGGTSGETLPLLIMFPRWSSPAVCNLGQAYSLLGFGDIIVPGFLVCFAHSFDIIRGDKMRPYFIVTMIGYGVGLAIAFVALWLSQTGQPALLYIVPCTLSAISITALIRKQFKDLWRGSITITEVEP